MEELALRGGGEEPSRMEESVQSGGRGFMGGVMDTLLNRKRKSVTPESLSVSSEVCDSCLTIYIQKYAHFVKNNLICDALP